MVLQTKIGNHSAMTSLPSNSAHYPHIDFSLVITELWILPVLKTGGWHNNFTYDYIALYFLAYPFPSLLIAGARLRVMRKACRVSNAWREKMLIALTMLTLIFRLLQRICVNYQSSLPTDGTSILQMIK